MKTAVLVIDMIKGMEEWVPRSRIEKIIPAVKNLLDEARAKGMPVIYMIHSPLGKQGTIIYKELTPTEKDIILEKTKYSSFYKTELEDVLKKLKISNLILTGTATNWCVLATALDADNREFETILIEDCVAAPNNEWHNSAIKWMRNTLERFEVKTSKSLKW